MPPNDTNGSVHRDSFGLKMFPNFTRVSTDFLWSNTLEPHATRRRQMLAKYPEIRNLLKPEPAFVIVAVFMLVTHGLVCYMLKDSSWTLVILQAIIYGGGVCNQLLLIIHETNHNAAFGPEHFMMNRLFEIFINLGLVLPTATYNWKVHRHHHDNLGQPDVDVDLPMAYEGRVFNTTRRKILWTLIYPILYLIRLIASIRHHAKANMKMTFCDLEILNHSACWLTGFAVIYFLGWKSYTYLVISYYVAWVPLHPVYFYALTSHLQYDKDKELYSYYGPLNMISFNLGLHTEHHDFPNMTGRNLRQLKKIAPEFYEGEVGEYDSALKCLWIFLTNDLMNPSCHVARNETTLAVPNPPALISELKKQIKRISNRDGLKLL